MRNYPQAGARKLCDRNLGLGESTTGPDTYNTCGFSIKCTLWISLKRRLKAVHSNALYNRGYGPGNATVPMGMQLLDA